MSYNPELLVTAGNEQQVAQFIRAGANAVNIGDRHYGVRMMGDFNLTSINQAIQLAHELQAKVYVSVNNFLSNDMLAGLPAYLAELQKAGADALVFADPAVLTIARQVVPEMKLHWSAEMTSTNYASANFWASKGASRFILARELNMEQVIEAKQHTKMEVQVQVHGITNIYHSKRQLVDSYIHHAGIEEPRNNMQNPLVMIEMEERPTEHYPIFEDENGTHVMSADDICMLENLPELLDVRIDSLKIEGLLKSSNYIEVVVRQYRQAIDMYLRDPSTYTFQQKWLDNIVAIQDVNRELSYGFFYKEQVY